MYFMLKLIDCVRYGTSLCVPSLSTLLYRYIIVSFFLYLVILSFLADSDSDSELPELPGGESDSDSDAEGRPSAKKRNTAGPWGRRLVVFS